MKRCLLAMLLVALMLVATAAPALARPGIGRGPPGEGHANARSADNPGAVIRTEPRTGGQSHHFF
jgi:hypothetical protein